MQFANFHSGGFSTATVANPPERKQAKRTSVHYTEVCFVSFLFGEFIIAIEVNPPEFKLAERTYVRCDVPILIA